MKWQVCFASCLALGLAVGLAGCGGEDHDEEMLEAALQIELQTSRQVQSALEHGVEGRARQGHVMAAQALSDVLEMYDDADPELRRVIERIRDGEQRLADGEVTGAEAQQLRQQHQEYWDEIREGRTPQ